MHDSRVLSFTKSRPRVATTPTDTLRRVVARMNDNIQIMAMDSDHSQTALKALARFAELAAIPARRRLARATSEPAAPPQTRSRGHL